MLLQQIVNSLSLGSIYALIALGYTLVYGILLLINFAHSEIFMMGAYIGLIALALLSRAPLLHGSPVLLLAATVVISMLVTGLLGVMIERVAYRPLRLAPRLAPLISAIGVSIFLQNFVKIADDARTRNYPDTIPVHIYSLGPGVSINTKDIFVILTTVFLMLLLNLFIRRAKMGKAMRATSQDFDTAKLMGIDVNKVISVTFFIGAALGGAAGALNGMYYGKIEFTMGFVPGIKAFTAAVLGGIGDVRGAVLGGFMLGFLETLGAAYISSTYKDAFAFIILILVLVFRPQGLFGRRAADKM